MGIDRFDLGSPRRCYQRRSIADEILFIERSAGLVVLHVPDKKDSAIGSDDFAKFCRYLSSLKMNTHDSMQILSARSSGELVSSEE